MGFFYCRCGSEVYASESACTQCGEPLDDPFEIRPVKELIWPAVVSLALGATCAASLWNHRDVGTWQSLLAGLISAAGLVLGLISLDISLRGRGMAIAGVALSGLALMVLTKSL